LSGRAEAPGAFSVPLAGRRESRSRLVDAGAISEVIAPMHNNHAERPPIDWNRRAAEVLTTIAPTVDTAAVFPAGYPLRQASFIRRRDHLAAIAAGHAEIIVPWFFAGGAITTLVTRDGMQMSRHMVLLMLNMSTRMERVLNELAVPRARDF
jgi:hypothetical protein